MRIGVLRTWRRAFRFGWDSLAGARVETPVCTAGRHRCTAAGVPDCRPRSAGPGWSPGSRVHPVAGTRADVSIDSEGMKESGGSTYDITIAYRCGRGQGGISKETGAHCPCLAPSLSLLPFLGFSLPSFLLPSSPHPTLAALVSNLEPHRLCCKGGGSFSARRTEKILYK